MEHARSTCCCLLCAGKYVQQLQGQGSPRTLRPCVVSRTFPDQAIRRTGVLERDHFVQAGRQAPLPGQHVSSHAFDYNL